MWYVTFNTSYMQCFIKTIELYFAWAFQKYMTHGVFGKIVCNLIFVTCNMCHIWHVKHVTCKVFIMTIELYFAWAFQKYMTHGVYGEIECILIFVTCNMCDMWYETHVTCNVFYHDHWTVFCMSFPKIYNTLDLW